MLWPGAPTPAEVSSLSPHGAFMLGVWTMKGLQERVPGVLVIGLCASLVGVAQGDHEPPLTADVLILARWADAVGDTTVLADLASDKPAATRLAAILAAPELRAPEWALSPLVQLAQGRDPDLAPAAATAAVQIANGLALQDLERRETLVEDLRPALLSYSELSRRADVRADIALKAGQVTSLLEALTGFSAFDESVEESSDDAED